MSTKSLIIFNKKLAFIYNHPELWEKLEKFCFKLKDEWWKEVYKDCHVLEERKKKRMEENRKRHELMWANQREEREKALKIKAKIEAKNIDRYRKMEFSALLKEYLALYFFVKICVKGNSDDSHSLKIIEREVSEFRSQSEQAELKYKVERLNRLSATLFKKNWLCNKLKRFTSWILGRHQ